VLQPSEAFIGVILIEAAEQPIERPKKDKGGTTGARKNDLRRKHS
jgi:hypothetical protein